MPDGSGGGGEGAGGSTGGMGGLGGSTGGNTAGGDARAGMGFAGTGSGLSGSGAAAAAGNAGGTGTTGRDSGNSDSVSAANVAAAINAAPAAAASVDSGSSDTPAAVFNGLSPTSSLSDGLNAAISLGFNPFASFSSINSPLGLSAPASTLGDASSLVNNPNAFSDTGYAFGDGTGLTMVPGTGLNVFGNANLASPDTGLSITPRSGIPNLSGMGGGTGLFSKSNTSLGDSNSFINDPSVLAAAKPGYVSAAGFTPASKSLSLGDPNSFINTGALPTVAKTTGTTSPGGNGNAGGTSSGSSSSPLSMGASNVDYAHAVANAAMYQNGIFNPGTGYQVSLPQLSMRPESMIRVSDIQAAPTIGQLTAGTQTAPTQYASGGSVKQPDSPIDVVQGLLQILQSYLQKSGNSDPNAFQTVKRSLMSYLSMGKPYFVSHRCIFLYEEKSPGAIEFHIMNGGSTRDLIAGTTEFIDQMANRYRTAYTFYDNQIISALAKYSHVPVQVKQVNAGVDHTYEMIFDLGGK